MNLTGAKNVLPTNLTIPTLPSVVQRIGKLLEDPSTGIGEIAQVIAGDAPLSAKVLKIANSAYYGLRERCVSTQQAGVVVGVRVLRNVVMQASVIQQFDHLGSQDFDLDGLWRHSIVTAQSCHFIGRRCRSLIGLAPDELYVCGLLHDLGKVVLLDNLKSRYLEIVRRSRADRLPLVVVESQDLGFSHADVGQMIGMRWGLPPAVISAIHFHHGPDENIDRTSVVCLVARTNQLIHHVEEGNPVAAANAFDARALALLGLRADDVTALIEFVEKARTTVEV